MRSREQGPGPQEEKNEKKEVSEAELDGIAEALLEIGSTMGMPESSSISDILSRIEVLKPEIVKHESDRQTRIKLAGAANKARFDKMQEEIDALKKKEDDIRATTDQD